LQGEHRYALRRMMRLTNAFSKHWSHLEAAYALWFALYNFCRIHKTLRLTPAMETGLTTAFGQITICFPKTATSLVRGRKKILQ
jgi:hypothetical protein